jgi:hypothetical protein
VLSRGLKSSSADAFLRGFRRVSDLDDPARGGIGIGKGMTLGECQNQTLGRRNGRIPLPVRHAPERRGPRADYTKRELYEMQAQAVQNSD